MADTRYAQFASSDPAGPDAAFWEQRVYFDGVPRRRREIVPTLAATPYMTEKAARLLLANAAVADGSPPAVPPAAWFADRSLAVFYTPDQPRDHGRFAPGDGGSGEAKDSSVTPTDSGPVITPKTADDGHALYARLVTDRTLSISDVRAAMMEMAALSKADIAEVARRRGYTVLAKKSKPKILAQLGENLEAIKMNQLRCDLMGSGA